MSFEIWKSPKLNAKQLLLYTIPRLQQFLPSSKHFHHVRSSALPMRVDTITYSTNLDLKCFRFIVSPIPWLSTTDLVYSKWNWNHFELSSLARAFLTDRSGFLFWSNLYWYFSMVYIFHYRFFSRSTDFTMYSRSDIIS